jgi:hypothetical protein
MNWYKRAGILEDVARFGPEGKESIEPTEDIGNPELEKILNRVRRRDQFVSNYGWAVPSQEAIDKIKNFVGGGQILEVGSGLGMWAKLIQDAGVKITPTDIKEKSGHLDPNKPFFTEVEQMDHLQALQQYGQHDVLMLVWPGRDSMAQQALNNFKGSKVIYVGENVHGNPGATGTPEFHDKLHDAKQWQQVDMVCIPTWEGMHDCMTFYERIK